METVISCILSTAISIVIGNYYLKKNDEQWKKVFDEVTKVTIEEVRKSKM